MTASEEQTTASKEITTASEEQTTASKEQMTASKERRQRAKSDDSKQRTTTASEKRQQRAKNGDSERRIDSVQRTTARRLTSQHPPSPCQRRSGIRPLVAKLYRTTATTREIIKRWRQIVVRTREKWDGFLSALHPCSVLYL